MFHVALAGVFLPVVSLFITSGLAFSQQTAGSDDPEHRRWTRRLWALTAVDFLVALLLLTLMRNPELAPTEPPPAGPRLVLGVELEGRRVVSVKPGLPAERAGLREGDEILEIDGREIAGVEDLGRAVNEGQPGQPRRLAVRRDGARMEISATPERARALSDYGLFEPIPEKAPFKSILLSLFSFLPVAVVGFGLHLVALRKGTAKAPVWRGVALAVLASFAAALGAAYGLEALLGGRSIGLGLLTLLVQVLVLLAASLAVRRWLGPAPEPPVGPRLAPARAVGQGAFYMLVGAIRLGVLIWGANRWLFGGEGTGEHPVQVFGEARLGVVGAILLLLDAVLLAPIAEELLFRGILLPRLAAQLGAGAALWGTAVLFALMHPVYLLGMAIIVLYGWVLGWARLRSGGLLAPVVLHMMINGLATALILLR